MAVPGMPPQSGSVCVRFSATDCPSSLGDAVLAFANYGDIAKIDLSLCGLSAAVFITFFDVRSAQRVLLELGHNAESVAPSPLDFRTVILGPTSYEEVLSKFGGFEMFGEVAKMTEDGDNHVVTFHDMRAAQQVLLSVPGVHPQPDQASEPGSTALMPEVSQQLMLRLGAFGGVMGAMSGLGNFSGCGWDSNTWTPWAGGESQPNAEPPMNTVADAAPMKVASAGLGDAASPARRGRPVREKVNTKDLTKFDIVPENIRSGEDTRTTIMVRNIPKTCSRDTFEEMLVRSDCAEACSFIYMPFDKRRDMHCGFAFVNLKTPGDVLRLFESMKNPVWKTLGGVHNALPAMSYARLQGHDELIKHFSLSAVMHDQDSSKRPIFFAQDVRNGSARESAKTSDTYGARGHTRPKGGHAASSGSVHGNDSWLCDYLPLDSLSGATTGGADWSQVSPSWAGWPPRPPGLLDPADFIDTDYKKEAKTDTSGKTLKRSGPAALDQDAALQSNAAGA